MSRVSVAFNSLRPTFGARMREPSRNELTATRTFDALEVTEARRLSDGYVRDVLASCPLVGDRRFVYIDVRVQSLEPGARPHKPGWHCDSTISPTYEGRPDHHHLFVTGDACLPEFIGAPVVLAYETSLLPMSALDDLRSQLDGRALEIVPVPSCTWVSYGALDFHRVTSSLRSHVRLLVRVRETDLGNEKHGLLFSSASQEERALALIAAQQANANGRARGAHLLRAGSSPIPSLVAQEIGGTDTARYIALLTEACGRRPPPFGQKWYGDLFRELALDPLWLATALAQNALAECEGALKATRLASEVPARWGDGAETLELVEQIHRHAREEAAHAEMFVRLVDALFPDALNGELRAQIEQRVVSTRLASQEGVQACELDEHSLVDKLVQLNLGEARTLVQVKLLSSVVAAMAHGHPHEKSVARIVAKLEADEASHLRYSAQAIARSRISDTELEAIFEERLDELNVLTLREVGGSAEGFLIKRLDRYVVQLEDAGQLAP